MKNRRTLIKIIIVMLAFLVVSIANAFHGNPISKAIAAKEINKYVESNFKDMNLIIEEPKFSFKFSQYYSKVYSEEKVDVCFWVRYRNKKVLDNYKEYVLGGESIKRRFEEEYGTVLAAILQEEFDGTFDRVSVEYLEEIDSERFLNLPLDVNDGLNKKIWLNLKNEEMTVEALSANLKRLHFLLMKKGYTFYEYGVWINGEEEYVNVTGVKVDMINDGLTELIQNSKDNTEEAFQEYGINTHFKRDTTTSE